MPPNDFVQSASRRRLFFGEILIIYNHLYVLFYVKYVFLELFRDSDNSGKSVWYYLCRL